MPDKKKKKCKEEEGQVWYQVTSNASCLVFLLAVLRYLFFTSVKWNQILQEEFICQETCKKKSQIYRLNLCIMVSESSSKLLVTLGQQLFWARKQPEYLLAEVMISSTNHSSLKKKSPSLKFLIKS